MEWLIVQTAIPAAVDFGAGGLAAVALAVAAVPACVLLGHTLQRAQFPVVVERPGEPMRHAA